MFGWFKREKPNKVPFLLVYSDLEGVCNEAVVVVNSDVVWCESYKHAEREYYSRNHYYTPSEELMGIIEIRSLSPDNIEGFIEEIKRYVGRKSPPTPEL